MRTKITLKGTYWRKKPGNAEMAEKGGGLVDLPFTTVSFGSVLL